MIYYVSVENISLPNALQGTKVFEAQTTQELLDKIMAHYKFAEKNRTYIQLWSNPIGQSPRIRLDSKYTIPQNYQNISVRGIESNHRPHEEYEGVSPA